MSADLSLLGLGKGEVPEGRTANWREVYARRLQLTDLLGLIWVVFGVQIAWFGFSASSVSFDEDTYRLQLDYFVISLILIAAWMAALSLYGTRGYRVLGSGVEEFKLLTSASMRLFGVVAIIAFLGHLDLARGYILVAFPLGLATLIASRGIWRLYLKGQRGIGNATSRVVLLGSGETISEIASTLAANSAAGYLVVGACVPGGKIGTVVANTDIPILGTINDVLAALVTAHADTVVVTSNENLTSRRMRELSWSLEPGRHHLVVVPSLTGIGGPRIHSRPVAGLPLIHIETPRYEGGKLLTKRAFDIAGSAALILIFSPFLAAVALYLRSKNDGPVFFRQKRVGINGSHFTMLKFRSMIVNAEEHLDGLKTAHPNDTNSVMFKMQADPRITPIGKTLRRYSLDELPQLFNVFTGSMSLVGPRPSLPSEAQGYENFVHRRFLVKPGITGPWQVGGRSNLSWEDTVQLDLYYVENWSVVGDLGLLWRTGRAVMARDGAF